MANNKNKIREKKSVTKAKASIKSYRLPGSDTRMKGMIAFLIITCIALYANTYNNKYALDDAMAITLNKATQKGFTGIKDHLKQDFIYGFRQMKSRDVASSRWRPFSLITFSIEIGLWGKDKPAYSHVINFLLYAWIVVLLFLMFYRYLFKEIWISFFAALLFAIHPIHTEVVTNIKSRDELLSLLFILISLHQLWKYIYTGKLRRLGASLLCFFISLTAKENAITFIAGIPVMLYFFSEESRKKMIDIGLAFLGITVLFLLIRNAIVPMSNLKESNDIMNNPYLNASILEGLCTKVYIFLLYAKLLIFPHPLSFDYSYNVIPYLNINDIRVWVTVLLYGSILTFALKTFKKKNIFSFCTLMFFITISISSNFVIGIGGMMGERLLFIPSIFFCIALAFAGKYLVEYLEKKISAKKIITVSLIMVPIFAASAYKTVTRNIDWEDQNILNLADLPKVPNSARVNNGVGGAYLTYALDTTFSSITKDSLVAQALKYINKAIEIYPKYDDAYLNKGLAYGIMNDFIQAEENWSVVKKRNPNNPKFKEYNPYLAHNFLKLGMSCANRQSYDSSLAYLTKATVYATVRDSLFLSAWHNLGGLYYTLGNYEKAYEAMGKVMEVNPNYLNTRQGYEACAYYLSLKK